MDNSNFEENHNGNKTESKHLFECYICLDIPKSPVAVTCGHIFCWKCLQSWISGKTKLECPVCRNGIDMNRVIPLYSNTHHGQSNNGDVDDRPKVERIAPVVNNQSYVIKNILMTFYSFEV
jgi:hypothetical protein